jgi:Flp pilus assembly protein TadD
MPSTGVLDTAKTASQTTASAGLTEVARQYQTLLERDPQRADALVGMSLVALASRQVEAAVKMATAATVAAPRMGAAWVALGQALKAAGCYEDAEQAYAQAIPFDGTLSRLGSESCVLQWAGQGTLRPNSEEP